MSAPKSEKAADAAARVMAGELKAHVSRDTGVSRATIDRHLARMKAEQALREICPVPEFPTTAAVPEPASG